MDAGIEPNADNIDRLKKYHKIIKSKLESDADLTSGDLAVVHDIIGKVTRKAVGDYTARNPLNRGEASQSRNPMAQMLMTFMSYATNQKTLADRYIDISVWCLWSTQLEADVPLKKINTLIKKGNVDALRNLGLTDEQIATYPLDAMEKANAMLKALAFNTGFRVSVNGLKMFMSYMTGSALAAVGYDMGNYLDQQESRFDRLREVPTNLDYVAPDGQTFVNVLQEEPGMMGMLNMGFNLAQFAGGEIAATGDLGPMYQITESIARAGNLSVPLVGILYNMAEDIYKAPAGVINPYEEMTNQDLFNFGRAILPGGKLLYRATNN